MMESPIKMDDLGVPLFSETAIYSSAHASKNQQPGRNHFDGLLEMSKKARPIAFFLKPDKWWVCLASSPCFLRHKKNVALGSDLSFSGISLKKEKLHLQPLPHLIQTPNSTKVLPTNWPWHGDNFRIEDFPLLPKKLTPTTSAAKFNRCLMSIRFLLRPCSENLPST